MLDNFFERGRQEGWHAFSCGTRQGAAFSGGSLGKRGHFTGLCVSIHLRWTRLTLNYSFLLHCISEIDVITSIFLLRNFTIIYILCIGNTEHKILLLLQSVFYNFKLVEKHLIYKKRIQVHINLFNPTFRDTSSNFYP